MTPAELKTTREALGLSSEWLAEASGVAVRTVRHWESGATRVPGDVAAVLDELTAAVEQYLDTHSAHDTDTPVTLLRFRGQEALREHTGLEWPVATHAIAQLRRLERLRRAGRTARLIWFDPAEYATWATTQEAPSPARWAADQPWEPAV